MIGFIQKDDGLIFRKIIRKRYHIFFVCFFCCRINSDLFQIFQGTLALRIKASDGIDLIIPQLDPPGIFLCEGININDPAPDRKMPRKLHLAGTLISKLHQILLQLIQIYYASVFKMEQPFPDILQRHQIVHTSVHACDYSHAVFFHKGTYHLHTLAYQQISMDICLEKKKILGRVKIHVFVIKTVVLVDLLCTLFVFRNYQMKWKKPGKSIHQMDLLGLHASGNRKDTAVAAAAFPYFFKLCKTLQRLQKSFHKNLSINPWAFSCYTH